MSDPNDITDEDAENANELFEQLLDALQDWADDTADVDATAAGLRLGMLCAFIGDYLKMSAKTPLCDAVERLVTEHTPPEVAEVRLRLLRSEFCEHGSAGHTLDDESDDD